MALRCVTGGVMSVPGVPRGPYKGRSEYSRTTATGMGADYRRLRPLVLDRDGFTCRYCGGPATTVDHVIPRSKGGQNTLENLVAACKRCNLSKGDRQAPSQRPRRAPQTGWQGQGRVMPGSGTPSRVW